MINWTVRVGASIGDAALARTRSWPGSLQGNDPVFQSMWKTVGDDIRDYESYPRIVGETGGKDFIVAHPTADVDAVATAIIRGSFEYQGQKCTAASGYAPASAWPQLRERLADEVAT